jgi:hypothetical protein
VVCLEFRGAGILAGYASHSEWRAAWADEVDRADAGILQNCGGGLMRPQPHRPLEAEAVLLPSAGQRQEEAADLRHGDRDQVGISAPFSSAPHASVSTVISDIRGSDPPGNDQEHHMAGPTRSVSKDRPDAVRSDRTAAAIRPLTLRRRPASWHHQEEMTPLTLLTLGCVLFGAFSSVVRRGDGRRDLACRSEERTGN